ncbi:outer membrane protein assembly factor BamB family protein [Cellulomonas carbonis]|uniref:Pyrrolo-quinoline quinone repeat domain-containing protein n=1 Tax=Cellulomonas carbonis T26 TaxID=947969 RepID=A0A0A0BV97_9CELL|nr:PQQ-binding-like beta-propeller repeat protein [Cellulomonas carbonis]KGM11836.1 hypothetical protein N868_06205 [Cellulomonas carbonis T26]GGB91967.1 hypothetical protein GCM10010972_00780 [Cellulomonas carbonis]
MRRSGGSGDVVDVELVEADDDGRAEPVAGPGPGPAPGPATGAATPPHGPRRRTWLAVGAAAAAVVVGVNGVQVALDAAQVRRWAQVPGVMRPMPEPPVEVWSAEGAWVSDQTDDVLLVGGLGGGQRVLDAATGEVLLELAVDDGAWCHVGREGGRGLTDPLGTPGTDLILCTTVRWSDEGTPGPGVLEVYDVASRRRTGDLALSGQPMFDHVVDGDVVVVSQDGEGFAEVVRYDPGADVVRWSYRSDEAVGAPDGSSSLVTEVVGEVLVLRAASGSTGLLLADGTETDPDDAADVVVRELSGERSVRLADIHAGMPRTQVLGPDGELLLDVEGYPGFGGVLDPEGDVLVVTSLDGVALTAYSISRGEELWRHDRGANQLLLQLGDVVVVASGAEVAALQASTGDELWSHEAAPDVSGVGLTDGSRVLVATRGDLGHDLVALDLDTGREEWRVPLPAVFGSLVPSRGGVVLQGGTRLVMLASP